MKKTKKKACRAKGCKRKFKQLNSLHIACSINCAISIEKEKREKKKKSLRRENYRRKESLRPRSHWVKKAQAAFNAYVRERDHGKPCISSGREMELGMYGGAVDCGHYRSTGSAPHLRFNLWNAHAQSVRDNRHLSGNLILYRVRLIRKIGIDKVEWLESYHEQRKFSAEYLKRIAVIFRRKTRMLKKRRERKEWLDSL